MAQLGTENTPLVLHPTELQKYTPNAPKIADSVIVDIPNEPGIIKRTHSDLNELPPHHEKIIDGSFDKDGQGCIKGCMNTPQITVSLILIMTLLAFIVLFIWYLIHYEWFWYIFLICFIVFWCIYTCEWMCSSSMDYLDHIRTKDVVYKDLKRLHSSKPIIKWKSVSYHYKKERHYDTLKGRYTTKKKRVTTHKAHTQYTFTSWRDISAPFTGYLEEWKLTKLYLHKNWCFADNNTETHYNRTLKKWLRENHKDHYQDSSCWMELTGFQERILVESSPGIASQYVNSNRFFVMSCFGLSSCYRCYFSSHTGNKTYIIQKEISC